MPVDVTSLSMPMAALIASAIGATATITAALIQLRIAWRKEVKARESRTPVTKKNRRGPVWAVIALMVASAVGGFALSQYLVAEKHAAAQSAEGAMREKLDKLSDLAARLERVSELNAEGRAPAVAAPPESESPMPPEAAVTPVVPAATEPAATEPGHVISTVMLSPCAVRTGEDERPCAEQEAEKVVLCAELPEGATLTGVEHFVRDEGDARPWAEARLASGQDPVDGAFAGGIRPGADPNTVCQEFLHWGSQGRVARLRVSYAAARASVSVAP